MEQERKEKGRETMTGTIVGGIAPLDFRPKKTSEQTFPEKKTLLALVWILLAAALLIAGAIVWII